MKRLTLIQLCENTSTLGLGYHRIVTDHINDLLKKYRIPTTISYGSKFGPAYYDNYHKYEPTIKCICWNTTFEYKDDEPLKLDDLLTIFYDGLENYLLKQKISIFID